MEKEAYFEFVQLDESIDKDKFWDAIGANETYEGYLAQMYPNESDRAIAIEAYPREWWEARRQQYICVGDLISDSGAE